MHTSIFPAERLVTEAFDQTQPIVHVLLAVALCALAFWIVGCAAQSPTPGPVAAAWVADYFPTQSWRVSTPEEQGVDSAKLAEGLLAMRQKGLNMHSLQLVRNGRLILDAYFYPYDGATVHELASVTKSVTTALIGIAADQGMLNLDAPVLSFFPDRTIANRDARKERLTVRHLASMANGMDSVCMANDEGTLGEMKASPDWVQFALDRKMTSEPGTTFCYDSPGMHLLSAILQKATGMTELEFARKNLFEPLGIKEVLWDADPQGYNHGWGDLFLYPLDLAKIGYLWANKGVWEGKQIVSRVWVENSTKLQTKTGVHDNYGYGWWLVGEHGEYAMIGRGVQQMRFYPTVNAILVMTASGVENDDVEPLVAPAFGDGSKPSPANPDGVAQLNAALSTITQAPSAKTVAPNPPLAQTISGKTFVFKPNVFQLKSIRLDFDSTAEARMQLAFADGQKTRVGAVGLDGVYRFSPGERGLPSGVRGSWLDNNTFVLDYDFVAARDAYILQMRFDGDRVVMDARERTRSDTVTLVGQVQSTSD